MRIWFGKASLEQSLSCHTAFSALLMSSRISSAVLLCQFELPPVPGHAEVRVIRGLADQHTTMIIVTHEMAFAREVADYVIFMDGGHILEQGTPQEVIDNPTKERTKQFLAGYSRDGM